ncbi:MAG: AhpC/TSA family protein [Alistipes sp.]|jgi:peroxiredoxin|nr:AhpC/TSA family protein [Alistipes sp.]
MKNCFLSIIIAAAMLCSCTSSKVRISGKFLGLNAQTVYLEQMSVSGQTIIDSVALASDGTYAFSVNGVPSTPTLYNVVYNNERIPLLVSGGEDVTVGSLGSVLKNYTVSGSAESELLREFNNEYIAGAMALTRTMNEYAHAEESARAEIAQSYNALYRDVKRKQITFIITNKSSIAAIYALYQRLEGERYLVNADSDIIYFRTVADAVAESYPESPLLLSLRNDVARMEAQASLLQSIEERNYPDIEADDMYGNKVRLSSLEGNVVLVDFWSAELGNSNALNADLKEIYSKYEDKGFRIYQVSADTSKAAWIRAVQEQRLPWTSVCDFKGNASPILGLYNVHRLPANYLIDRDGTIIGRDLYSTTLEKRLEEIL